MTHDNLPMALSFRPVNFRWSGLGPPRQCRVTENSCLDSGAGARETCKFSGVQHTSAFKVMMRLRALATDRDLESGCDSTQGYRARNSSDCFGLFFCVYASGANDDD